MAGTSLEEVTLWDTEAEAQAALDEINQLAQSSVFIHRSVVEMNGKFGIAINSISPEVASDFIGEI